MYKLYFLILAITLAACSTPDSRSGVSIASERICSDFIQEINRKHPELKPIATGGGEKDGKITLIGVVFKLESVLTVPKAREYIVSLGETMLTIINSNEDYFIWFHEGQARITNFDNDLIGKATELDCRPDQYVFLAGMSSGDIYYSAENKNFYGSTLIHKESFDEAKRLVNEQRCISDVITH